MSLASKVTLAASCTITSVIVALVHKEQNDERERIHLGVIRDQERQERKRQNQIEFEEQQRLTQYLLEKQQRELKEQGLLEAEEEDK